METNPVDEREAGQHGRRRGDLWHNASVLALVSLATAVFMLVMLHVAGWNPPDRVQPRNGGERLDDVLLSGARLTAFDSFRVVLVDRQRVEVVGFAGGAAWRCGGVEGQRGWSVVENRGGLPITWMPDETCRAEVR